jgi:hypothetical protein
MTEGLNEFINPDHEAEEFNLDEEAGEISGPVKTATKYKSLFLPD